jgi:hypothetical protein
VECSGFILRRRIQQLVRRQLDNLRPRLALQLGMKLPVAIQVHRRQVKNIEVARHPGGLADIHLIKYTGLIR